MGVKAKGRRKLDGEKTMGDRRKKEWTKDVKTEEIRGN